MPSPNSAVQSRRPIPGFDYPRNLLEFQSLFPDEAACADYLERLRWPDGFVCPLCGHRKAWRTKRGLHCAACERRISPTAGTVFAGARLPLRALFLIAWEMVGPKVGASALNPQKTIGLNRYDTAWTWHHKFRRAMVREDREQLSGRIEIDDTYVGGVEAGKKGRETATKSIVIVAVEVKEIPIKKGKRKG